MQYTGVVGRKRQQCDRSLLKHAGDYQYDYSVHSWSALNSIYIACTLAYCSCIQYTPHLLTSSANLTTCVFHELEYQSCAHVISWVYTSWYAHVMNQYTTHVLMSQTEWTPHDVSVSWTECTPYDLSMSWTECTPHVLIIWTSCAHNFSSGKLNS